MNKTLKRVILTIVIIAVVIAAIWGILTVIRASGRKPVNVYPASYFTTTYWGDESESYGMVTTDKLQKIYLSETQTVKEVYVSEGDSVSKGDKLLAYDTTLTDIELEKAQIAIDKSELEKTTAEGELKSLKNATSTEYLQAQASSLEKQLEAAWEKVYAEQGKPVELPVGSGTGEDPYYVDRSEYSQLNPEELLAEREELWLALVRNDGGSYTGYTGLHFEKTESGYTLSVFDPPELPSPEIVPSDEVTSLETQINRVYDLMANSYPKAEIARMLAETEKKISDLELSIKIAKVELAQKEKEISDGVVLSDFDGVVMAVRDAQEAFVNSEAVLEVSGGGGYYVTCYVSELERNSVQVGQSVTVNSWMNGMMYEGEIVELKDYPADNADAWTSGNSNVSWYPFVIFISADANLQEYDYVSVTYQKASDGAENSMFLESFFIRTENGKTYVMVQNESGLLEKRYVSTGRDLWGSYTEILSGLSEEEFVAFPYGQDVTEGAKTVQAEASELYNY
ncbi:MAG: biotin/lipoyl-binding protein [Oscillospiraceae bacterium]|nr:biotin/lipoyl-binding protein [Oscillospiraceae bacterium]